MPLPWEPPSPPKKLGTPTSSAPSLGGFYGFGGQTAKNTTGYKADLGPGPGLPSYPYGYDPPGYNPGGNYNADDPYSLNYNPPALPEPNYNWSLENDPIFQMTRAQVNARNAAAGAAAGTGFGQAFGNWGEIPDFAQTARDLGLDPTNPLYGILMNAAQNPNTLAAAQDLTARELSTVGGYNRQNRFARGNWLDQMGARGTFRSGATGVGLRNLAYEDQARRYSGAQALLQKLTQIASAYNTAQQEGLATLGQGAQQAALRQLGLTGKIPEGILNALNIG